MSIRSLNGLGGETNVYLNRDPIQATEPVLATQPTVNDPITISLKGLSGYGGAGKVVKVNSSNNGLEYADDIASNWTISGSNIYPTTATQVLVNTTSNSDNRKLLINGDAEIATQLYLTGTSSTIQIDNNSSSGLYFKNATSQGFKFFADNGNSGSPHLDNETISGYLFKISSTATIKHRFLNGTQEIYSDGASTDTTKYYFVKASDTNIGNYIQNDFTNNTFQLRTFTSLADNYFLQYDTANEELTIPYKLKLTAASNQLSNGTYNYILPSGNGTLQLTTDPANTSASTLFGTAVAGGNTIKMGNTAGTAQTTNLELYFSASLKLYNTSNVLIGQFTPVSNTCNLSLNSGVISSATWNGSAIAYNYGGTGLNSLTANKILQVNSTANGYNLISLPTALWEEGSSTLSIVNSSTKLDLNTNTTYNLLNTDVRVIPTALSEGQLISYDSGLGGGNGSMVFGSNSTSASSGWDTGIYAKQFVKLKCSTTEIASFSVSPVGVKLIELKGPTEIDGNLFVKYFTITNTNDMTCDPVGDGTNICKNFTISSGAGANGDCILKIEADTDNLVEESNARLILSQDNGSVQGILETTSDNSVKLSNTHSGGEMRLEVIGDNSKIILSAEGGTGQAVEVNSTALSCSDDFECSNQQFLITRSSATTELQGVGGKFIDYHTNGTDLNIRNPTGSTSSNSYHVSIFNGTTTKCIFGGLSERHYGEYTSFNTDSLNGTIDAIGFTTHLSSSYSARYPILACDSAYLYVSLNNTSIYDGVRSGGTYSGYFRDTGWVDESDIKWKTDVKTITDPFSIINNIRGVHYYWNELSGKNMDERQTGFIANEVKEVLPDVCNYNDKTETWGIQMGHLTAVLVEGMKEQQTEIETLKTEITDLKEIVNTLKETVDKLNKSTSFKEFKSK